MFIDDRIDNIDPDRGISSLWVYWTCSKLLRFRENTEIEDIHFLIVKSIGYTVYPITASFSKVGIGSCRSKVFK